MSKKISRFSLKKGNLKSVPVFFFLLLPFLAFSQEMEFREEKGGVLLLENGEKRYFYHTRPVDKNRDFARANYIHPLYGLDGEVLTEDFPDDHPHHHGIFWSWHQLYAEGERIGDPWFSEGIEWEVRNLDTQVKNETASLEAEVFWVRESDSTAVIKEDLLISFERINQDAFFLNFNVELTALVEGVAIGGSEDAKGYGGFSPRFELPEDISFHSVTGKVEPQETPVEAGPWIDMTGTFGENETRGIAIMGEPEKLPSYRGWILRSSGSMQNMAFPGSTPLPIEKGETLKFRNRVLVHQNFSTGEIEELYHRFSGEK